MGRPPSWGPHRSGHFQRHLDDLLGFSDAWKHEKHIAELTLPGNPVHSAERMGIKVPVRGPSLPAFLLAPSHREASLG